MTIELSHELLRAYVTNSITREELLMICNIYEVKRFARQYLSSIAKNFILIDVHCDEFLHSEHASVRVVLAQLSYRLDILIHDKSYLVRRTVAETGYSLSQLIFDENESVRLTAMQYLKTIRRIDTNDELLEYENSLEYHHKLLSERSDE
jgi:hypothetical protein